jgi:hypothetical protein
MAKAAREGLIKPVGIHTASMSSEETVYRDLYYVVHESGKPPMPANLIGVYGRSEGRVDASGWLP